MIINKNLVDGRCKVCGYDLEARPAGGLFKSKAVDRRSAKQYCEHHRFKMHSKKYRF